MVNKNDLSALKIEAKNTFEKINKNTIEQAKAWRKPLPTQEKLTELIWLRFTLNELEQIKEKSWLVPIATYLKYLLKNQTKLFNK